MTCYSSIGGMKRKGLEREEILFEKCLLTNSEEHSTAHSPFAIPYKSSILLPLIKLKYSFPKVISYIDVPELNFIPFHEKKKNLPYTEMDDEESMAINVEKCIKVVFLLLPLKLRFSSFSLLLFVMLLFPFRRGIECAFIIINVKSDPAAINHECREDTFSE
ncbi:hypothetical protein TNCV_3432061 [Trichonephila clavipes]|nr:hypothetical protein TNCV_3432061 [Trichonephila clavipes]